MNATTAILIALTLAILLVAAFYGMADSVIDTGGEAIDNFSDTTEDDEGNTQFSSAEPDLQQKTENIGIQRGIV